MSSTSPTLHAVHDAPPDSPTLSLPPPYVLAERHYRRDVADDQHSGVFPIFRPGGPSTEGGKGGRGRGGTGRGGGRSGAGGGAGANNNSLNGGSNFARISLFGLELRNAATAQYNDEEGLQSSDEERKYRDASRLESDSESDDKSCSRSSSVTGRRCRGDEGEGDDDGVSKKKKQMPCEDDMSVVLTDDEDEAPPPPQKQKAKDAGTSFLKQAVMGNKGGTSSKAKDMVSISTNSSLSGSSISKRKRYVRNVFPVKGVNCIGCTLSNMAKPVDDFIKANIHKKSEQNLYKMAQFFWRKHIMDPAMREGVRVQDWQWTSIATHYKLHVTCPIIGRTTAVQTLSAMRMEVEQSIVREEGSERMLDKQNADLMLKILAAESRERELLSKAIESRSMAEITAMADPQITQMHSSERKSKKRNGEDPEQDNNNNNNYDDNDM